tara:strand:- start:31667 stop:32503 length:837 start_codon:yes stop_codon:yes gene_type:complete
MGTAIEAYKAKMAAAADKYASEESTSSSFITTRGGILKFGEEELPGNEMLVVILDAIHENTYYPDRFDSDVMSPPKCFAMAREEKDMQPHENIPVAGSPEAEKSYFEEQAEFCDECPLAEWGSADTGRGKACSNRRRLALIPAGQFIHKGEGRKKEVEMEVFEDPSHYRDADISFLKLPVTSGKAWSKYVHQIAKEHQRPPFGVLTHVYIEADEKTQFKIKFDLVEVIESEAVLEVVIARNAEAMDMIIQPYSEPSDDQKDERAPAQSGLRGLNKGKR